MGNPIKRKNLRKLNNFLEAQKKGQEVNFLPDPPAEIVVPELNEEKKVEEVVEVKSSKKKKVVE